MNENKYKIILSDGLVIDNLELNGDNFISRTKIDPSVFDGTCSPVTIECDGVRDVHDNMQLIHVIKVQEEYWIALRDLSKAELNIIQIQSDIAYLAMMTACEL